MVPRRRAAHDGRVSGPTGHHDVGGPVQSFDDAPAAEVGVGAHEPSRVGEWFAGRQIREVHTRIQKVVEATEQVVTGYVGDGGRQPQPVCYLRESLGTSAGI